MTDLVLAGVSHHRADVDTLERVAVTDDELPDALRALVTGTSFDEGLILSTCNRTELYAGPGTRQNARELLALLASRRTAPQHDQTVRQVYVHGGENAVRHLFRVTAGLDSMLVGEVDVARQVSDAYDAAVAAGTAGPALHRVVSRALHVGKQVRTETAISRGITSLAGAAMELTDEVLARRADCHIVTVGAGRTIEKALRILRPRTRGRLVICNRTAPRADALAAALDGDAAPLSELAAHAADADILVAATGTRHPVLRAQDLLPLIEARGDRPLLVLDLGLPRNVEPAIGRHQSVRVHDVDDLRAIARRGRERRRLEIPKAEAIVSRALDDYRRRQRQDDVAPKLRELHDGLRRMRDDVNADADDEGTVSGRVVDRLVRLAAPRIKDGSLSPDEALTALRPRMEAEKERSRDDDTDADDA